MTVVVDSRETTRDPIRVEGWCLKEFNLEIHKYFQADPRADLSGSNSRWERGNGSDRYRSNTKFCKRYDGNEIGCTQV